MAVTRLLSRPPVARTRWWYVPPLILALLPFVVFAPITVMWRVFSGQDLQAYFYPYHVVPARMLADGHLPLWNPYVFSGIPLLADGQTAMFYPPNWLFFVMPAETALNLVVLLQFSIAGVGMFAFARTLGLWRSPAVVAALAFMFCGSITARVVHLSIMSGAALIPAIFTCVERLLASDRQHAGRWCAAAAGVLGLQAVAGHPQVPIYTALAAGLFTVVRAVERHTGGDGWRQTVRSAVRIAGAYALGYLLAAVQLLPWIELARLSTRAAGTTYAFVFRTSTAGAEWLLFLFPYMLGAQGESIFASGPLAISEAARIWEHSAYVGILPLALALVAAAHFISLTTRRFSTVSRQTAGADDPVLRHRWFSLLFLVLLLATGILMAAGWHTPFGRVLFAVPGIGKLRAVERALVLAAFALTALAGFGLQHIVERPTGRKWLLVAAVLIACGPALFVWHAKLPTGPLPGLSPQDLARLSPALPHTWVPLLLAFASALLLAWWSRTEAGSLTQALAIALVAADLSLYAVSFTPTAPRRLYRQRPQVVGVLQEDTALFRKATWLASSNDQAYREAQHTLAMSWAMVHGIDDVNGFNSLQPRRYTDYVFGPRVDDVSYGYLRDERLLRADNPVLSSLNVRYVIVPSGDRLALGPHLRPIFEGTHARVYENTRAYPRAYFADRIRADGSPSSVFRQVTAPGFDGRREALVESASAPALAPPRGPAGAEASRPGPNALDVVTTTIEPRYLVVSEMYFPGWRAYVDGVETAIYRTNYLFRGVVVPAGRHTVRFEYRPASVLTGAVLSLAALAVTWLLVRRR